KGRPGMPLPKSAPARAAKALRAEILVGPLNDPNRLNGAGMIVVSPPWTLENKLSALGTRLGSVLGRQGKAGFRVAWLIGPMPNRTLNNRVASFPRRAVGV